MKYWLNWGEISGKPGTAEEFTAVLGQYARKGLLIACGRLTVEFNYGPEGKTVAKDEITKQFIPRLFPPDVAARVKLAFEHDRVIFFQGQLRYIAAEVARLPIVDGLPEIENHDIGELLLRAAELMTFQPPKPEDPMDALASKVAELVPFYEIDTPTDAFDQLMRIYIMLTVNISRLASKEIHFNSMWRLNFIRCLISRSPTIQISCSLCYCTPWRTAKLGRRMLLRRVLSAPIG